MGPKALANITLRLTNQERELLKILNAALKVSDYTDQVENERSYRKNTAIEQGMAELFTTLTGLSVISNDLPPKVRDALKKGEVRFITVAPIIQRFFEIGRRFKRMNPDKMRAEYGKLVMLLQDSAIPPIRHALGFNPLKPIRTVGDALKDIDALSMLSDPIINVAIYPLCAGYTKYDSEKKNKAIADLITKYGGGPAGSGDKEIDEKREVIELCILSIGDAISLIETNRNLVKKMIFWLEKYFGNQKYPSNKKFDLSIRAGVQGAKLSHDHRSQFLYVKEALTLWSIVQRDIFKFWENVERDMLEEHASYRNMNTGQGIHRVSSGPNTAGLMHNAVSEADREMGGWVGIKVVHMGDQDVPNPLVFIDKYTIIPRLLGPIVHTIEELELEFGLVSSRDAGAFMTIPDLEINEKQKQEQQEQQENKDDDGDNIEEKQQEEENKQEQNTSNEDDAGKTDDNNNNNNEKQESNALGEDAAAAAATSTSSEKPTTTTTTNTSTRGERYPGYRDLVLTGFESGEDLVIEILKDFFRHGFNGAGDDGGSCIDGRLTSAWNWCSELHKKKYYQAFLLTGFVGFDANYN